jgi:cell division protein FtsN
MKPRRRNEDHAPRKPGGNTLLGIFIGVVAGVLGTALVVWYINKMPIPFSSKGLQSAAQGESVKSQPLSQANGSTVPAALPGKPGDPTPQNGDKPRFDFYKILPGNSEAIPEPTTAPPDKSVDNAKVKGEKEKEKEKEKDSGIKNVLYLQTGSFSKADDADNQKAKLALSGMEATVQQVMLQDRVWYRVRLGPFTKIDDVNRARSELAKQGIEANVVKKD